MQTIPNLPIYKWTGRVGQWKMSVGNGEKKPELIARFWVSSGATGNGWMTEKEADCGLELSNLFVSVLLSFKVFQDSGI